MNQYHKIKNVYKRCKASGRLIKGDYSSDEIKALRGQLWHVKEKIDGTNIRVIISEEGVSFKAKTDEAKPPIGIVAKLESIFNQEMFQRLKTRFGDRLPVCFYGEGCGGNIQSAAHHYSKYFEFILFDVRVGHHWMTPDTVKHIGEEFGLKYVYPMGEMTLKESIEFVLSGYVDNNDKLYDRGKLHCGNFSNMEGVIVTPKLGFRDRHGNRIIAKIKRKDFVL